MSPSIAGRVGRAAARAARLAVLDPRDAALGVRMAGWIVIVSALARATSLPQAHRLSTTRVRRRTRRDPDAAAARLATAIDRLLRLELLIFRKSCWRRAMVLHRYLALEGIDSRINFGVQRKADGSLAGHAWLEHRGAPFLEDDAAAYVVTFTLPLTTASIPPLPRT
jgi:hypothetical protein